MTPETFEAWGRDIEYVFRLRAIKWGYAITLALLALVLTQGG
jgi:hypothetical protein